MSYDISIVADLGPTVVDSTWQNYTYNVGPMFREALGGDGINDLHGKPCHECLAPLRAAITDMQLRPDKYRALNPENGWGNASGALGVLLKMLDDCEKYPNGIVDIS